MQGSEVGLVSLQTHTQRPTDSSPPVGVQWCSAFKATLSTPQNTQLLSQRAGSSVSPPSHCPHSLLSPSLSTSSARQTSSLSHLNPECLLYHSDHQLLDLLLFCCFSSFAFSLVLVFVTRTVSRQLLTPSTWTGLTVISKQTPVHCKAELLGKTESGSAVNSPGEEISCRVAAGRLNPRWILPVLHVCCTYVCVSDTNTVTELWSRC